MNKKLLLCAFVALSAGGLLHGSASIMVKAKQRRVGYRVSRAEQDLAEGIGNRFDCSWTKELECAKRDSSFDINMLFSFSDGYPHYSDRSFEFTTLLFEAMQPWVKDRAPKVKLLLDNRADADSRNKDGLTALMLACSYGFSAAAAVLVKANPDTVRQVDEQGFSALARTLDTRADQSPEYRTDWSISLVDPAPTNLTREAQIARQAERQKIRHMLLSLPTGAQLAKNDADVLKKQAATIVAGAHLIAQDFVAVQAQKTAEESKQSTAKKTSASSAVAAADQENEVAILAQKKLKTAHKK